MNCMNRRGSVSLETSISFGIVIIFITAIISVTVFLRTDILMQRAVSKSCEDFAHLTPFSITASDAVSTLTNALPDSFNDNETVVRVGSLVSGLDEVSSGGLRAAALNILLGQRFSDDIASEYCEYNGSTFWMPDEIYVDFNIGDYYIEVYVIYSINTIIGPVQREIISTIPFYGDFELFLSESEGSSEVSDDIWHRNNFERGRAFAQRYGANLPPTFPVINYRRGGEIGSIVSIDLNRPTYSVPSVSMLRISEEINQLAGFDGADVTINRERIVVRGEDIRSRTLIVVIPQDSPEALRAGVYSMENYALINGVTLRVEEYGTSS